MKIVLIGGVSSTLATLSMLRKYAFDMVDVYGYEPKNKDSISGYINIKNYALRFGYSYIGFEKINDHCSEIKTKKYDYIFVVGLSQLISDEIIESAKYCCIGFHPTRLPKGRGRAPIAWLILDECEGAATFFQIKKNQEADSGPILSQACFEIDRENDTANTIENKILKNIEIALDRLLPDIINNDLKIIEQDESSSSEYGIRKVRDGYIDWRDSAEKIKKHIRSAVHPHPGAFAFIGDNAFQIKLSQEKEPLNIKGVIGRVLKKDNNNYLIQTGNGSLWIEAEYNLKVGMQLGTCDPYEIYELNKRLSELENFIRNIK